MKSVIVVGAGIWGTSLALRLAESGWRVTLVEQYQPGHLRQASAGETRLLRASHGTDDWYARMARRARELWRDLGERVGEELYAETGMLWFARRAQGWERASASVLERLDIPHEIWDPARAAALFPDFRGDDLEFVLWEPQAGVVRARRATQVTARLARAAGVTLVRGRAEPYGAGVLEPYDVVVPRGTEAYGMAFQGWAEPSGGPAVRVGDEVLRADRVVWACGAWLPRLFPGMADLQVTKQDTAHFAVAPGWDTPAWVDYDASVYGHGDLDGLGMKVTSDIEGEPYDPETGDRRISPSSEEASRAYLRRRFPSLAQAPVLFSQVCQYTLTLDGEWVIAQPEDGVWLLGGDSGHGFKHAPALAEYVAEILDGAREPEPRFGLHPRVPVRGLRTSGRTDRADR
ncbi:NAD(P)/FAD-dependent oxidoreductase [Streptosporangium roseum]|uniref:FAD dependent oxidoreductase n=1 Tax=Streptosporangium roseum (strain ATCC 12428 / DSM 43021 / JCM 3005 / KCTC 9067 / NCIMB 10171 / NRRL 2505 / NI 9100) TaxID=479432 RepID=D2B7E3_STRRD|nr:FAD-dependent oxidoreductase [Streptosporangium roseum]ACZ91464.1 FAD dependent oxidoreductase [Streptosporangium roseum DSM 43021]